MNNLYIVHTMGPHSINRAVFHSGSAARAYVQYVQMRSKGHGDYTLDIRVGQKGWDLNDFQPCPYYRL